jgi:hypothetical protein
MACFALHTFNLTFEGLLVNCPINIWRSELLLFPTYALVLFSH